MGGGFKTQSASNTAGLAMGAAEDRGAAEGAAEGAAGDAAGGASTGEGVMCFREPLEPLCGCVDDGEVCFLASFGKRGLGVSCLGGDFFFAAFC